MNVLTPRALLLVVSAPSGAGKTTLCRRLLEDFPMMRYSISCTTRAPRPGEQDGRDYFFLSKHDFLKQREEGKLLEWAEVHGYFYGTPRAPVEAALGSGCDVIMDIDVQGAAQLRALARQERQRQSPSPLAAAYVDIFIMPPNLEELRRRLEKRHQDAEQVILRRLENARREMQQLHAYQYALVNDNLEEAYARLRAIVIAEHCRLAPCRD